MSDSLMYFGKIRQRILDVMKSLVMLDDAVKSVAADEDQNAVNELAEQLVALESSNEALKSTLEALIEDIGKDNEESVIDIEVSDQGNKI